MQVSWHPLCCFFRSFCSGLIFQRSVLKYFPEVLVWLPVFCELNGRRGLRGSESNMHTMILILCLRTCVWCFILFRDKSSRQNSVAVVERQFSSNSPYFSPASLHLHLVRYQVLLISLPIFKLDCLLITET